MGQLPCLLDTRRPEKTYNRGMMKNQANRISFFHTMKIRIRILFYTRVIHFPQCHKSKVITDVIVLRCLDFQGRRRIISAKSDIWNRKMKNAIYLFPLKKIPKLFLGEVLLPTARIHKYPTCCFSPAISSNFR